ncbi:MAG TPA: ATP-binding protein [Anaeromyxobacter sp.]|nr:ATP-binding protein [Anaeromyxobacter sp.]
MTKRRPPADLRRAAEARLGRPAPRSDGDADVQRIVHELRVHQIELEMQNEELRGARAEVESALARYTELFDFAPIGYFRVLGDGRIRELNFAGARLLGAPRGQIVGRPFRDFVSEHDRATFDRFLSAVLTRDDHDAPGAVAEFVLAAASPPTVRVRVTATLLDGQSPSALLAAEDVTARREAEEALREEGRRREEFLATLSHELRNPLAPIRNGLVLLQRVPPGGEAARSALCVIDRQVTHLTRIVEDLLDVTRIARGKIRLQRERLELATQVLRALEDHRPAFDAAGVRLECAVGREPCWIDADASRIAQVLGNLLGNALKFTNAGGRVEVVVRREPDRAVVVVRDTGVGVAPDALERIFEPFSQAPQTLDRTRGGLGLGLTLVRGLVDLHGGSITAASPGPGQGTAFFVALPLASAPRTSRPAHEVTLGRRRRVLVIDDNVDAATTLKDVLELGGHEVRVAFDGPGGLATAHEFRPEIVICDIGLPGMDGYDVARELRRSADAAAWLVAMSGYAAPDDLDRARAAGFDRHVAKPATLEGLEALFAEAPVPQGASS